MNKKIDMCDVLCQLESIVAVFDIVNGQFTEEVSATERCDETDKDVMSRNFVRRSLRTYIPALGGIQGNLLDLLKKVEEATDA